MRKLTNSLIPGLLLFLGCIACKQDGRVQDSNGTRTIETPYIEILDEAAGSIIDENVQIEILAEGFAWSEGPVWVEKGEYLLFSDIPNNTVFKWKQGDGLTEFLKPSGYTGDVERGGEMGSNGLLLDSAGRLVLCQHGDRRIALLSSEMDDPRLEYTTIVGAFKGMRLNSPNDAVFTSNQYLYFTDPPYGLEKQMDDPAKELPFQGVYLYKTADELVLLTDSISRPNGIGLSPDEKTLYIANSDPDKALWMAFDRKEDGSIENGRVFFDATHLVGLENEPGLPDGLKVSKTGFVFATGPGGVWIFSPGGKPVAKIRTGQMTANCAFGLDEKILYMTAHMYLMRVALK